METAEANPDWVSGAAPLCGVVGGSRAQLRPGHGRAVRHPRAGRSGLPAHRATSRPTPRASSSCPPPARSSTRPPRRRSGPTSSPWPCSRTRSCRPSPRTAAPLDSQVQAAAEAALIGLRLRDRRALGHRAALRRQHLGQHRHRLRRALLRRGPGPARRGRGSGHREADHRRRWRTVSGCRADRAAVRAARKDGGEPSGTIEMPTLTLHTAADPLVAVQNQTLLREASGSTDDLVQLFTVAPDTYPAKPGAPYGAGHCNVHARLAGRDDRPARPVGPRRSGPDRGRGERGVRRGLRVRPHVRARPLAAVTAGRARRPSDVAARCAAARRRPLVARHATARAPAHSRPRRTP